MSVPMYCTIGWLLIVSFSGNVALYATEDVSLRLRKHLEAGKLTEADDFLQQQLALSPKNEQVRFALGFVQFLSAVEKFFQDQHRYGALSDISKSIPFLRLPLTENPFPEEITYPQAREIISQFQERILEAESVLAEVQPKRTIKLRINLMAIRLDLNGDGITEQSEEFSTILGAIGGPNLNKLEKINFDNGDVHWLRAYCHSLGALCDMLLAYDQEEFFDVVGQLIYPKHVPAQKGRVPLDAINAKQNSNSMYTDSITAIHLVDFPLAEPGRMASARQHLLAMVRESREAWRLINDENDNDDEWIPNPRQSGVLDKGSAAMIFSEWNRVLDEIEDLLEGRKLVPFWRDVHGGLPLQANGAAAKARGINLKRFFDEPRPFDLVLDSNTIENPGESKRIFDGFESRKENRKTPIENVEPSLVQNQILELFKNVSPEQSKRILDAIQNVLSDSQNVVSESTAGEAGHLSIEEHYAHLAQMDLAGKYFSGSDQPPQSPPRSKRKP